MARYPSEDGVDGLPPGEGVFLACSFWLADNLCMLGRVDEARALFGRLLGLANDVGLLAEEYDPTAKRMLGNFPQAFTHVSLVNTACNLAMTESPARHRGEDDRTTGMGALPKMPKAPRTNRQADRAPRRLDQPTARIAPASNRPTGPGTRVNSTRASPAIVRVPSAIAVQWKS